ncbi:TspO/MBR family protein [Croceicoccus marinus]|jgi:tryptophan-rich sensory protein|uniref:Tryptophan-rich sensory protein n=1 Tax=Croceicoccus marinus TaxID=450378 RepID=A0A7G6VW22_9SPHN|nr:TspO/MBR family protein [Croceicoccus marinus]QNE05937.1 tryptophan-rich sensory protein [Croceicoccus marinus]
MVFPISFAAVWAIVLLAGGALLTPIGDWYRGLGKPRWQPPDWLFGPAWTIILGLAAWAFVLCWDAAAQRGDTAFLLALYLVNGVVHFLWSPLFFKARRPDWALIEVPFLWLSVLSLCVFLREWSVLASWLVVPYLAWVSFAAVLNWSIVRLNGPFTRHPSD